MFLTHASHVFTVKFSLYMVIYIVYHIGHMHGTMVFAKALSSRLIYNHLLSIQTYKIQLSDRKQMFKLYQL